MSLVIVLLIAISAGCSTPAPQMSAVDRSFVTGKPCTAPCWYGLELDKAKQETVLTTVRGLEFVDQSSIRVYDNSVWPQFPTASEVYFCSKSEKHTCNTAVLSEGELKMLWLSVEYDLTLSEAVQRLGEPDYISYSSYSPEARSCRFVLYWPKDHIFVENVNATDDGICQTLKSGKGVKANTKATGLVYAVSEVFTGLELRSWHTSWPGFAER